jgi:hypothetical protein
MTKIFPGAIAAIGLVWDATRPRGRRGRGVVGLLISVSAVAASWLALGGVGVFYSIGYHMERGVELGSLYAGLLIAAGKLRGAAMTTVYTHSCTELVAPGATEAAALALPLQLAGILAVMARFALTRCTEPMRFAGAAILAFVIFGKVLSPQYMIWLFPFLAVAQNPLATWARVGFLGACCVTTLVYPWGMDRLVALEPLAILALNARNGLLLVVWLILVFGPVSEAKSDRKPVPSGTDGALRS